MFTQLSWAGVAVGKSHIACLNCWDAACIYVWFMPIGN